MDTSTNLQISKLIIKAEDYLNRETGFNRGFPITAFLFFPSHEIGLKNVLSRKSTQNTIHSVTSDVILFIVLEPTEMRYPEIEPGIFHWILPQPIPVNASASVFQGLTRFFIKKIDRKLIVLTRKPRPLTNNVGDVVGFYYPENTSSAEPIITVYIDAETEEECQKRLETICEHFENVVSKYRGVPEIDGDALFSELADEFSRFTGSERIRVLKEHLDGIARIKGWIPGL